LVHMTKRCPTSWAAGITVNCIHPGTTRTERTPGLRALAPRNWASRPRNLSGATLPPSAAATPSAAWWTRRRSVLDRVFMLR
jgi:NAD(P)-dependent dehydrogenase (short-subunit alcohol dehydrogenase family)